MLTVSQYPQIITPAYNDQFIVALSDEVANYTDFYYDVEVTIDVNTYNFKVYPRPDEYMVFNVMETVKNHIQREIDFTSNTVEKCNNKSVIVQVYVLEYYNGTTTGHDSYNYTYIAFDACYKDFDFIDYDNTTIINGTSTSLLGSNVLEATYPDSRVTLDTDVWIHFFNNDADKVQLRLYNSSNVLQATLDLTTPSPTAVSDINYLNIGASTFINNSPSYTPQYGWYVEFEIIDGISSMFESSYTFTDICYKYPINILYYLKRNGNIGYFHFDLVSTSDVTKQSNTVRLNPNTLVGGVYSHFKSSREKYTVSTQTTKNITLNSNWITETQSNALEELFDSPVVWLKDSTGEYLPVTIKDTTYKLNTHKVEKLFNYTINLEFDRQETRQRGL